MALAMEASDQTGSGDNVVEVSAITKYYGSDVHALDSIDLGFPTGQMTTLLGPSVVLIELGREARAEGQAASANRRWGLLISTLIISLVAVLLYLKIRQLEGS